MIITVDVIPILNQRWYWGGSETRITVTQ